MEVITRSSRYLPFVAVAIVLLTVATRLPSLVHPQTIDDEAVYSLVANEIVDGGRPYIDAVERKPPLLFWTYAAVFEVAGKYNWKALHAVALLCTLGTMAGLYVIGRQLFDREAGLIAALLYSIFQPWAVANNLAFNGELLMNLPIVWAWAIALGKGRSRPRPELLAAGALLCVGFLLKQPAAIAAIPLGIYLLLPGYRASRRISRIDSFVQAAMLTVGFSAALGLVVIVLVRQRILREAFYWTFTNHTIAHVFWSHGILHTLAFIGACLPLVIGAAMAVRNRDGLWTNKTPERIALFGLLIVSAVGAAAGARFYPHYYIQLIPPLAMLAAPHFSFLWRNKTSSRRWFFKPSVSYTWLALTVVAFAISHWNSLARDREPSETARYLAAHSALSERIFIWGPSAAHVYVEARRRPACRYVLTFPLTGFIFGEELPGVDTSDRIVPNAWEHLQQDFRDHPPVYIADLYSDPGAEYPARNFPILARLLAENYEPVARTGQGLIYRAR